MTAVPTSPHTQRIRLLLLLVANSLLPRDDADTVLCGTLALEKLLEPESWVLILLSATSDTA